MRERRRKKERKNKINIFMLFSSAFVIGYENSWCILKPQNSGFHIASPIPLSTGGHFEPAHPCIESTTVIYVQTRTWDLKHLFLPSVVSVVTTLFLCNCMGNFLYMYVTQVHVKPISSEDSHSKFLAILCVCLLETR